MSSEDYQGLPPKGERRYTIVAKYRKLTKGFDNGDKPVWKMIWWMALN